MTEAQTLEKDGLDTDEADNQEAVDYFTAKSQFLTEMSRPEAGDMESEGESGELEEVETIEDEGGVIAPEAEETDPEAEAYGEVEHQEETAEATAETESEGEEQAEAEKPPPMRVRLKAKNELDAKALALYRASEGMTLLECAAIVAEQERQKLMEETGDTIEGNPMELALPKSVAELEAEISKLEEEEIDAIADWRNSDAAEIKRRIKRLQAQRETVAKREKAMIEAEKLMSQDAEAEYREAEAQAKKLFPDYSNPNSELFRVMAEIDSDAETNDPGLFNDPEKPLIIARMAAKRLRIAPATIKAPAPKLAQPKNRLAPATGRVAPATSNDITAALQNATPTEWKAIMAQLKRGG